MKKETKSLGDWGENKAAFYLIEKGFQIREKNFSFPFGEIDIIAEKSDVIYFLEIKTRRSERFGQGWEAVDQRKIQKIQKVAEIYMDMHKLDKDVRLAVISIVCNQKRERLDFFLLQ